MSCEENMNLTVGSPYLCQYSKMHVPGGADKDV